jgi:hypothetical protein
MKNIRLIVPVIICLALSFYIIGCGNATGGGGGGGGGAGSGNSGKLVDPYITGAIVYVDLNNSGSWDAGEPTAETGSDGQFTFTTVPSLGAIIRVDTPGMHLGITYDASLATTVDSTGILNITPLTTMLANGISAESIRYILQHYAAITIDANDMIRDDPMSGLVLSNLDSIAKIRGAICTYALIQIISYESGVNGNFDIASIEGNTTIEAALGYMGDAVRSGLSDDILTNIHTQFATAELSIKTSLEAVPGFVGCTISVDFPDVTADDVANSAFAITRYVIQKSIENAPPHVPAYDPEIPATTIETLAINIGTRYWAANNRTNTIITVTHPLGGVIFSQTVNDALISGEVRDANNVLVTTFEVNSTTEAFIVNENGTIEVVWKPGG